MEWIVAILVSLAYWIGFFVAYFIIFKPFDLDMTPEEKAKAYDEALEKAKEIKSKILSSHLSTESCRAVSEYIDEIIPELRESEDLEEAAEEWCKTNNKGIALCADKKSHYLAEGIDAFIAGAEWQKANMIKTK